MSDVKFVAAGKFTSREQWIHPDITVPTTEIIIVTDGVVNIEENGVRYSLAVGDVLVLSPGVRHFGFEVSEQRTSFYWLHLNISDSGIMPQKQFRLNEPYHVSILCSQILHYSQIGVYGDAVNHLLSVLLCELKAQSCDEVGDGNASAHRIVEWIRINSDRNITAADVAEKFGYNEDYVSRLLKKHYGSGLKTQINEHKKRHIGKLLLETEMSLAQIADESGFSDYKLFLKFFKYHFGMTPSEFRRVYYAKHTNNR